MQKNAFHVLLICSFVISLVHATVFIPPSHPNLQYIGRYVKPIVNNVTYDWPGFQIFGIFTGTTLGVIVQNTNANEYSWHNVFIDGTLVGLLRATGVNTTFNFGPLDDVKHSVLITQRGDSGYGPTAFLGFLVDDNATFVTPPTRPSRRIEIIGDSITVGGAMLGPCNTTIPVHVDQDNYLTYGALTARNLSADYMVEAISGIAMMSTPTKPGLPVYYERLQTWNPNSALWDFSWVPQAVIIHLGTNDIFSASNASTVYIDTYVDFVDKIFQLYSPAKPQIFILCGSTIVPSIPWCPYAQQVANQVGGTFVDLSKSVTSADIGCVGHPNPGGHEKMAAVLIPAVQQVMGW